MQSHKRRFKKSLAKGDALASKFALLRESFYGQ